MIRFVDAEKFPSNPGSPIRDVYSPKVQPDGSIELEVVGKENTDELIQASKDSCDIASIYAYYNATGDESVLNRYVPNYGDFTVLPKTFAEMLQLRIDSEKFFEAMPDDVRQSFDNDVNKFFATAGEKEWLEKIAPILPKEEISDLGTKTVSDEVTNE